MRYIVLNFHGFGEPHSRIPLDERPYWLSFKMFHDLLDRIEDNSGFARFSLTFDDGNASDIWAAEEYKKNKPHT